MRVFQSNVPTAIAVIALCSAAGSVKADFLLESQKLSIDQQTHAADFSLTFNQVPDFASLDSQGRPVNSFQIDFAGNYIPGNTGSFLNSVTGVVRGDEIHLANDIRVRSGTGNGGPNSGGWGPVVGSVPFSLVGETVSFSVPTQDLGWTGHRYEYEAISLADGQETASQHVSSVPTPAAFSSGIAGLLIVGGISWRMRHRATQRTG